MNRAVSEKPALPTFKPGEPVLSETSLRFLPLERMRYLNHRPITFNQEESSQLLNVIHQQFEDEAFCSVCKVIRARSAISVRTEIAAEFLNSNSVRKGPAEYFPREQVRAALSEKSANVPLRLVLPSYSIKTLRYLKTNTSGPGSAEMFGLLNLMRITKALQHILNRACKFIILSDGLRFQKALGHSIKEVKFYQDSLYQLITALKLEKWIELHDYENYLQSVLDREAITTRTRLYHETVEQYRRLMLPVFNPSEVDESFARMVAIDPDFDDNNPYGEGRFVALFRSLLFSINITDILSDAEDPAELERALFSDIFNTRDAHLGKRRSAIIFQALHASIEYMARIKMDRVVPDNITKAIPSAIRCTIHPKPGQLALISVNQRTRIEPWHGVGYLKKDKSKINLGVDFRIALEHSGFKAIKFIAPWSDHPHYLYVGNNTESILQELFDKCDCRECPL